MLYDLAVVGGSFAGISAALHLARARRSVIVIDARKPRNRFAEHSHGVLGQDGKPGSEIVATGRKQLAAYPTATLIQDEIVTAKAGDAFTSITASGMHIFSRRLLIATGVEDVLPDVPGLRERWGKTIATCPYCHGFEIGGGSIGVLATSEMSVHQALLLADWGDITLFTNGVVAPTDAQLAALDRRSVRVETQGVVGIDGEAPAISSIRLRDNRSVPVRALFIVSRVKMASTLPEQLGCALDETPLGSVIRTDPAKATTVAGVYAAGDAARAPHNITFASADGVTAALGIHQSLIAEDAAA